MAKTNSTSSASLETYESILSISKKILGQTQLDRLLDLILDEAISLSGAERGFIVLLKDKHYEIVAARNLDKESLKKAKEKISTTILREVMQKQEPLLTVDALGDEKLKKAQSVHNMKLRSILAVPLKEGNNILGIIYLDNRFSSGIFQESHAKILGLFADQAALAIFHTRLLEENRARQKELEEKQQLILKLNKNLEEKISLQESELAETKKIIENSELNPERRSRYLEIIGESKPMTDILKTLDKIIDSDVTVYIHGESGTGKELIAKALHYNGPRKDKIFVSTNCASFSDTLLESELFGHVRGAFTGAEKDKKGIFEFAEGGTVFLDEVGDMSMAMQAKLLRVLQEREIRPVGSNQSIKINVRIISASNKDLAEEIKKGKFRKDLYYRLNVVRLNLPALRERKSDIPKLVEYFMKNNKMNIPADFLSIEPEAMKALMLYTWPGNIRELENEINRSLVMGKGTISKDLLSDGVKENYEFEEELQRDLNLSRQVGLFEKRMIERALQEADGNKAKAAELLDISRLNLYQKIKNLKIDSTKKRVSAEEVRKALKECNGNKALAARRLGIQRQTLYQKLNRLTEKS